MDVQTKLIDFLDSRNVPYQRLNHEASRTSAESAAKRGDSTQYGAKALVLKANGVFMLFVMRANLRLDYDKVQILTGAKAKKIRFATTDELLDLTGLLPGSVPPFGYPILPLHLYIDQSIADGKDLIGFNVGSLTASLKMNKEDYLRVAGGQLAQFTSSEPLNATHHDTDTIIS